MVSACSTRSEALCESLSLLLETGCDAGGHGLTVMVVILLTTTLLHEFQTEKKNLV